MKTEFHRQMIHLSGLLFVLLAQFLGRELSVIYFSVITVFFLLYSWYIRSQEKKLERFLHRAENKFRDFVLGFERRDVRNPFTGAMFFYLGFTVAFLVFPFPIASAACAMLAVGDSLSALVGTRFGKHGIADKTAEGSLACFAGSLVIGLAFVSPSLALAGALAASLAEFVPRIDDNLTIPLAAGAVMLLISLL